MKSRNLPILSTDQYTALRVTGMMKTGWEGWEIKGFGGTVPCPCRLDTSASLWRNMHSSPLEGPWCLDLPPRSFSESLRSSLRRFFPETPSFSQCWSLHPHVAARSPSLGSGAQTDKPLGEGWVLGERRNTGSESEPKSSPHRVQSLTSIYRG